MCDYSLHAVASRPAKVGETLISTGFRGAQTLGFASPAERGVAVCLLPGTELAFEENVRYRGDWFWSYTVGYSVAKFSKIAPEIICQHHDCLEFPDGSTVLVNSLVKGQRVKVLQMPISDKGYKLAGQEHKAAASLANRELTERTASGIADDPRHTLSGQETTFVVFLSSQGPSFGR